MLVLALWSANAGEPDVVQLAEARRRVVTEALAAARGLQAEAEVARDEERATCVAHKVPGLEALERVADGAVFVVGVSLAEEGRRDDAALLKLAVAAERAGELLSAARACGNELPALATGPTLTVADEAADPHDVGVIIDIGPTGCGTCR